jgi:diacylglycerol kinase family enzyme
MPPDTADPAAPLLLVNPRASKMADPAHRARVVEATSSAIHRRYGRMPRVEDGTLDATRQALAEAIANDTPVIVVIGGDGTVREAAAALIGRDTPLAVIPGGTGNVLAFALGIGGVAPAIEAIRAGRTRQLDLGRARWETIGAAGRGAGPAEERIFIVACGMGLDARIMAAAEHAWKRRMRFGAYVGAAFRELFRLEPTRYRIVADGEPIEMDGYLALVANAGELVPGRLGPRRPIDPADGLLDLIVLGGRNPLVGARGAVEALVRTGDLDGRVVRRAIREVSIDAEPVQPIETDGDAHPPARLDASVIPGALTVLAPPSR